MNQPSKPFYFIPENDHRIEYYASAFESLDRANSKRIDMDVDAEMVETKQVAMIQEMLLALQHFPQILPKLLFSFEFKFAQIPESQLYFPESEWKSNPMYHSWFRAMMDLPIIPFFLRDPDTRFYAFVGDIMHDGKVDYTKGADSKGRLSVIFSDKQVIEFSNRLFHSCWLFHLYCHGSGYNPQHDIEAMLAVYDLPITYEQIHSEYEKNVREGIQFRVTPKT